jgi:hypothetical protein
MKTKTIALVVSVVITSFTLGYLALAWTEPSSTPPDSNVNAPLNTSINAQSKEGALIVGANEAVETGLVVQYGKVGFGISEPNSSVDIAGEVRLSSSGDPCSAANEGAMRYLDTDKCLYLCDGESWSILYCGGSYTLTMANDGNGTSSDVTGQSPYEYQETVSISASPNSGYEFSHWSAPAGSFGNASSSSTNFTMPAQNVTVTANFEEIPTYTLTMADDGNGTSSDETDQSPYENEESVTISASPNEGYQFSHWSAPAGSFGNTSSSSTTFTMPAQNVTVTANFEEIPSENCGDNVTFTYRGSQVTYGTVENPDTGECWLDRNLGASQVATAYNDSAAYGDLFQWGRLDDGHQSRTSGTTSTLSSSNNPGHSNFILSDSSPYDWRSPQNDNLWQGVDGINNPCPDGWRIPTEAEWEAERTSWSSNNYNGAFDSPLKLTVAGTRARSSGSLYYVGSYGYYWSSMVDGINAPYLYFSSSPAYIVNMHRAHGFSARCILD